MIEEPNVLAQFWGWMFVGLSLVFLVRGRPLLRELFKLSKDRSFSLISGYMAFIVGLASVILYNAWTADWRVAVTLIGWLSVIKGITLIGFPETFGGIVGALKGRVMFVRVLLVVTGLIGLWLLLSA